ncbi:MAG: phosphate butyryltransferase [Planctomycetota bacterium]|nr:MAG: phosphate butyryltransferase [Planctomycetota bacterium]
MYDNFDKILEGAKKVGPVRVAVAGADAITLSVMAKAKESGIAEPVLVEDEDRVAQAAEKAGVSIDLFEIVTAPDARSVCTKATELVSKGKAAFLMKGHVPTPEFFRAALNPDAGLRGERQLSHCFLFTTERSPRIKIMTDGALNVSPDAEAKAVMIENAVSLLLKLGYERPRAAVLSGTEEVRDDVQASLDAAELVRRHEAGAFENAVVDGPIALDVAVDIESARRKGLDSSPVAGKADILVTPDLLTCNIAAKCIYHFAHARYAGIVVGARAPVVSLSRADTERAKLDTLALGVLASRL